MAIKNLYPNLPGHLVEFKDGGLQFVTNGDENNTAKTKSLLILGTAFDGPVNNPVKINSDTVETVFGSELDEYGRISKATITKAARQAFRNGFTDVRCMRVTGKPAEVVIEKKEPATPATAIVTKNNESVPFNLVTNSTSDIDLYNSSTVDAFPVLKILSITNDITGATLSTSQIDISDKWNGKIKAAANNMFPLGTTASFTFQYMDTNKTLPSGAPSTGYTVTNGVLKCEKFTGSDAYAMPTGTNAVSIPISDLTLGDSAYDNGDWFASEFNSTDTSVPTAASVNGYNKVAVITKKNVFVTAVGGAAASDGLEFTAVDSTGTLPDKLLIKGENYSINQTATNIEFTLNSGWSNPGYDKLELVSYRYPAEDDGTASSIDLTSNEQEFDISDMFSDDLADIVSGTKAVVAVKAGTSASTLKTLNATSDYTVDLTDGAEKVKIIGGLSEVSPSAKVYVYITYTVNKYDEYKVIFRTSNGGKLYNSCTVEIESYIASGTNGDGPAGYEGKIFRFTKPEGKYSSEVDHVFEYNSWDFPTVELLAIGMRNDIVNNGMFEVVYDVADIDTSKLGPDAGSITEVFSGGDDGVDNISEQDLYYALSGQRYTISDVGSPDENGHLITAEDVGLLKVTGAYQLLENYSVDYIYPAGVYADSKFDFFKQLSLVCAVLTYRTKMTHGFIDVKPNPNTTLSGVNAYTKRLMAWSEANIPCYMTDDSGTPIADNEGKYMELGWYVSVVAGPEIIMSSSTLGTYYGSPAIAYAALNATLAAQSSPTNKAIQGTSGMKFLFSNKQMNDLVGSRFVVFKSKDSTASTPYVVDGCTAGSEACDYNRISTVKVVTDVVDQIREVCEPFLGEPNTIEQRNAMSALISKRLTYLKEAGEIHHFEFEVISTIQQMLLGECQISLTLVPPTELRKITTVVALRAAA
jgi:hypothetical protein